MNAIKDWLGNFDMWQNAFPETPEEHLQWLMQNLIPVRSRFIKTIVNKITVSADSLKIIINAENLRKDIARHSEVSINAPAEKKIIIAAPFKTNRGKNGAIIIATQSRKNKDQLDLPAGQLKRIVRGIIWRDEHFSGDTIKDIGLRTSHGENYVNLCIQESFAFLSQ